MVDMKSGPPPAFFPPYVTEYPNTATPHHHLPSSSGRELSHYLHDNSSPPSPNTADASSYWPPADLFSPCRVEAYYLGEAAINTNRSAAVVRSPPASASPTSSRGFTAQRINRSARTATHASPTATGGAGDVVPASTSSNARGAQFTIIANVPYDTVRQDLVSEFRKFGRVELAMVVCDEASRHPHKEWTSTAGYAFVRFSKRSEAAAAIQAATMGLITIRGTRVRADWARKDSYAKRGRVSPAQGAPSLNPSGVPDGITLLQDSLNRAAARNQWSMYGDVSTSEQSKPTHGGDTITDNWTTKATDIESPTSTNERALQVLLEDALVQALELIGPQKSPSTYQQTKLSDADHLSTRIDHLPIPTRSVSPSGPANCPRLPSLAIEHAPIEDEISSMAEAEGNTTAPGSGIVVIPPGVTQELASALSPASRGLLTIALSDVTAHDAYTDVSPIAQPTAPSTRTSLPTLSSPEELLRQRVQSMSASDQPTSTTTFTRKAGPTPGGPFGASTASDFSSLPETEDIACSEGSMTPPL